jgi:hypothetical protein
MNMGVLLKEKIQIMPTKYTYRKLLLGSTPLADAEALVIKYPVMRCPFACVTVRCFALFGHLSPQGTSLTCDILLKRSLSYSQVRLKVSDSFRLLTATLPPASFQGQ